MRMSMTATVAALLGLTLSLPATAQQPAPPLPPPSIAQPTAQTQAALGADSFPDDAYHLILGLDVQADFEVENTVAAGDPIATLHHQRLYSSPRQVEEVIRTLAHFAAE